MINHINFYKMKKLKNRGSYNALNFYYVKRLRKKIFISFVDEHLLKISKYDII